MAVAILARTEVRSGRRLSRREVKELEAQYGKHKFCYQCGNPDIVPVDDQHLFPGFCKCPNCGSSDLDAG